MNRCAPPSHDGLVSRPGRQQNSETPAHFFPTVRFISTRSSPPTRIETSRLVLRLAQADEAHLVRAAIDSSLDHLRAWMPWALNEPRSLADTRALLTRGRARFSSGDDFQYSIFDAGETEIVGGIGLHRRSEQDCLEIGYWIRADRVGQGFATESARALTEAALQMPDTERVQIDCDPSNVPSKRVPEKLGYTLVERREGNKRTPSGDVRDTLVYQLSDLAELRMS